MEAEHSSALINTNRSSKIRDLGVGQEYKDLLIP